jgi:pilus assembly protein Flp/PilA
MEVALAIWVKEGLTGLRAPPMRAARLRHDTAASLAGAALERQELPVRRIEAGPVLAWPNQSSLYHPARSMGWLRDFVGNSLVTPASRILRNQQKASMKKILQKFMADETGATAIEYGLIAAGISLAIISIVNGLGPRLNAKFTAINNSLH